jgi:hypothetical protein
MNLIDVSKQFATQEACVNYLEQMRWPDGVVCLKCGAKQVRRYQTAETTRMVRGRKTGEMSPKPVRSRFVYHCSTENCGHQFTITTGTIFHDSHLDLEKWFNGVALMCNTDEGYQRFANAARAEDCVQDRLVAESPNSPRNGIDRGSQSGVTRGCRGSGRD